MKKRRFILTHKLAPGDEVCTTALVRDLKTTYGDSVEIDFRNNFPAIYEHNPHLTPLSDTARGAEHITLGYQQGIHSSRRGNKHHFLTWFYRDFADKSGLTVECLKPRPDLHLTPYERANSPIQGRYWLIFAGGKSDFTVKIWDFRRWQEVVDELRKWGVRFVQSGATRAGKPKFINPKLHSVLDLTGWGYVRQLLWQIYHADGVLCPVTSAMHIAASFEKPCVVVAGGREEPWWEAYDNHYGQFGPRAEPVRVPHKFLHTLGLLSCCKDRGCWKNKVVKIDGDSSLCQHITEIAGGQRAIPQCLDLISADHVINAVLSYYEEGVVPPIGLPQWKVADWRREHLPAMIGK